MNKKISSIIFLSFVLLVSVTIRTLTQETVDSVICENIAIVQTDDWLSKIAEKFYGDILAFPVIVEATNAKATLDNTYTRVESPDIIEPGWKLCIPTRSDAQTILEKSNSVDILALGAIEYNIPAPGAIEYNPGGQFVWEWEAQNEINVDWFFDIKIYRSYNAVFPYDTLVADPNDPQKARYFNGKWYSELRTNFQGCPYWAVQIAQWNASGDFEKHISPESNRMKVGTCADDGTDDGSAFSSPIL